MNKWKDPKLWVAICGVLSVILGSLLSIDSAILNSLLIPVAVYIVGDGAVTIATSPKIMKLDGSSKAEIRELINREVVTVSREMERRVKVGSENSGR
jgi:hypothetical protein